MKIFESNFRLLFNQRIEPVQVNILTSQNRVEYMARFVGQTGSTVADLTMFLKIGSFKTQYFTKDVSEQNVFRSFESTFFTQETQRPYHRGGG